MWVAALVSTNVLGSLVASDYASGGVRVDDAFARDAAGFLQVTPAPANLVSVQSRRLENMHTCMPASGCNSRLGTVV
jgi:hypothetical protein